MNMHQRLDLTDADMRPSRARRTRAIVIGLVVLLAVLAAAWFLTRDTGAAADEGAAEASAGPTVSVMTPEARAVTANVRVTGSIAARRDLPVGVQGQGGQIVAVLVDEGDYVRKGQVLARVDKSVMSQQVAQLRAGVERARADAKLAQSELDRAQALVDRGFISQADIERRTASRDSANAQVSVSAAQLRAMEAQLGDLDIRAPEAGLILERRAEAGQIVSGGSGALFRLAEGGQMELQAEVAEQDLAAIKVGQSANIVLVGSPVTYTGEVWKVSPIIDPATRQGTARILVRGGEQVRPGAFATGTIETGTATRPVLPESAVLGGVGESYVYIVDGEDKAQRRSVRVGSFSDDGVAIEDGLDGSERVVVSAGAFINEGETVTPRPIEDAS